MLVQKLRVDDLQSEKGYFDGVMVYAQNKVPLQDRKYMYSSIKLKCNFEALLTSTSQHSETNIVLTYILSTPLHLFDSFRIRLLMQNINQVIKGDNQVTYWVEISSIY